jgi:hypothetical protein
MFVYEKYEQARKRHIRNCNKNLLHGPGYRSVNAVQLSLQSGRNTQLRTSTILVIFSCFRNTTDTIASNIKKTHNIYLYNRQYLLYIIIWGIVFSEYFKQKLFLFVDLYLSPDKLARKIYLSGRFYVRVGHDNSTPILFWSVNKHGHHRQFLFLIGRFLKQLFLWNRLAKWY